MNASEFFAMQAAATKALLLNLKSGTKIAKAFVVHFHANRAFIEPCMRPVLQDVAKFAQDPKNDLKLLIVGHTDKTDTDKYNQALSERRARSVFAYLRFGCDKEASLKEWNSLRQPKPAGAVTTINDSWGVREYQQILQDLGFYPGKVNGKQDDLTKDAVREFRCQNGLPPGTTVDDSTWAKLIEAYMKQDSLCVPEKQFLPNGSEILKWLGCGEESPLLLPKPPKSTAFRPYRRVELLFVDDTTLPCKIPQPDTFDLPEKGFVGQTWALGPGEPNKHCCFATRDCQQAKPEQWCIELAELTTITVKGSIVREDGKPLTIANRKFVLITPDGEFKAGEQSSGEAQPALAKPDGSFEFPDKRVGIYSLEIQDEVLVRLENQEAKEAKGNAVCKRLTATDNNLAVVILKDRVLREIRPPVVAHLIAALHPDTREIRTCVDPLKPTQRLPQKTARTPDKVRELFKGANEIWRQARIRFDLVDIVEEVYAHSQHPECEVDEQELADLLFSCAYPNVINVFFFGSLRVAGEAGVQLTAKRLDEQGQVIETVEGIAMGDRVLLKLFANLDPIPTEPSQDEAIVILSHELGHYLSLGKPEHVKDTPANADRLMLPNVLATHRKLIDSEIKQARQSDGADLECIPLSLQVTKATQVGSKFSHEYIFVQPLTVPSGGTASVITVDAVISEELVKPGVGSVSLTGDGQPGATDRQRTVNTATTGTSEIVATYTPTSGKEIVSTHVVIRVARFRPLQVQGNTRQVGGSDSTMYVTRPDPTAIVTIVAQLTPTPFCIPKNLVVWDKGNETPDPLRRTLSRSHIALTTISAKVAGETRSVTIAVVEVALTINVPPFDTIVDRVQIEGVLNSDRKSFSKGNLFGNQINSLFRARADIPGVVGNTLQAKLISRSSTGTVIENVGITLTRMNAGSDRFVSLPLLAIPVIPIPSELKLKEPRDLEVVRAQAGGKIRLEVNAPFPLAELGVTEVKVRGRVVHIFASAISGSGITEATIRGHIQVTNRVWAQAGIEVRERGINASLADPGDLLKLDGFDIDPFTGTLTPEEQSLLTLNRSAVNSDVNVYYVKSIDNGVDGESISSDDFSAVTDPDDSGIILVVSEFDTNLAHELGHLLIHSGDEHTDPAGKDWPESNLMHRFAVLGQRDLAKVQVLLALRAGNPFVTLVG